MHPRDPGTTTDTGEPSKVVLLAEDDVLVRNLLMAVLQTRSFEVLTACDGMEALELSRSYAGTIDLLITDIVMPRMDGDSLTDRLLSERPGIRILQISGHLGDEMKDRKWNLKMLPKPFLPQELLSKIDEVMAAPPGTRDSFAE